MLPNVNNDVLLPKTGENNQVHSQVVVVVVDVVVPLRGFFLKFPPSIPFLFVWKSPWTLLITTIINTGCPA